ncbi:MAG: hypothetical protein EZS28_007613 [Streblomastix strix]|uniref:Uncharacterized protein n=1 Tax=Streblomastix strix TaxID=222440 RepID=A0A5J4WPS5_9EUKA|nr:MAG: hypothetical protein EZS28_007613 [Streblomastix strix]
MVILSTNVLLVDKVATDLFDGQNADKIEFWTNVATQTQLEDIIVRSHLAADLIHRSAAPILEISLFANTMNVDRVQYDLQAQPVIARRLIVLISTHILDCKQRNSLSKINSSADLAIKYGVQSRCTDVNDGNGTSNALTPAILLTRTLSRATTALFVNPNVRDLIRQRLLTLPTQDRIQ